MLTWEEEGMEVVEVRQVEVVVELVEDRRGEEVEQDADLTGLHDLTTGKTVLGVG